MKNLQSRTIHSFDWRLILIGIAALVFGAVIYFIDRRPDQIYFIYKSCIKNTFFNATSSTFGWMGWSLPSFIHVYAFILITIAVLDLSHRHSIVCCVAWLTTECLFEIAQVDRISNLIERYSPNWINGIPYVENTVNYFVMGTFDLFDLLLLALGTVAAYLTILLNR